MTRVLREYYATPPWYNAYLAAATVAPSGGADAVSSHLFDVAKTQPVNLVVIQIHQDWR